MSIKIMAQVWELDLRETDKLLLLSFADCANDQGICAPSFARIAWKCCVSKRTVQRAVHDFATAGLLAKLSEAAGPGRPSVWRVTPQKGVRLSPFISDLERSKAVEKAVDSGVSLNANGCQAPLERVTRGSEMGDKSPLPESKTGTEDLEPKERGDAVAAASTPSVENPAQLKTAIQNLGRAKSFGEPAQQRFKTAG